MDGYRAQVAAKSDQLATLHADKVAAEHKTTEQVRKASEFVCTTSVPQSYSRTDHSQAET